MTDTPEKQLTLITHASEDYNRIYWHSRRGMLELDLVLLPFVEQRFADLSIDEQQDYIRLLRCEDQDLFVWLMQRDAPSDLSLVHIVNIIVEHGKANT